ncbi:MAG: helicase-related protein [Pseudomonadota bacterium]
MTVLIVERANSPAADAIAAIRSATAFSEIEAVFRDVFLVREPAITPGDYKDTRSDFGLKVRGLKARENINAMARDILSRVQDPEDMTDEDRQILEQYSGRGGLTENSQFEYYTPTGVAQGMWDAMAINGFTAGNVLDPCVGAGVFPATKPKGVIVTGTDIDPVGSKIASLLNPEDGIQTGSFERLVASTPDDSFDAVTGNVPFGDARGAAMHDDPAYKSEKRIERYFLLRALDKCRPGGLCCLVVPTNIVGAKGARWEEFRIQLSKKAEFLGAHKLPSKTFKTQGTDTVVDIVVFKKHPRELLDRIDDIPFETLKAARAVWDEFTQGLYWLGEGKRFIQGKWVPKVEGERWSREVVDGDIDAVVIRQKLAARFESRIDWDMLESAPAETKSYIEGDRKTINGRQHEMRDGQWVPIIETKPGDMALDKGRYGASTLSELRAVLSSPGGPLAMSADNLFAVYKSWPELLSPLHKDAVEFAMSQPSDKFREQAFRGTIIGGLLGRLQANPDDAERERLQALVVTEVERFGHPKGNRIQVTGESSRAFGLFMNAVDEKGTFSALLSGVQDSGQIQFDPSNIQSIVEHLFIREGIQNIELEDVKQLYAGGMKLESLGDLASVEHIALTPDGFIQPMGRYTSGDVYPKVAAMTAAMADETDERIIAKYGAQIDAINRRVKITLPENIYIGLQEKWFPKQYLIDYLREHGYPNLQYGRFEQEPREDPVSGKVTFVSKFVEDPDAPFGKFIGVPDKAGFARQFDKYLNGGRVTSSGEDAQERIEAYKQEVKNITEGFNAWMQQHPDMDRVAAIYNRKFNAFVAHDYELEPLEIEGMSGNKRPHGFQSQTIRRLSEEGRGIAGLDVGLGKTMVAIGLHLYNKQMGRTKKDCIVVPNSVLSNWYQECHDLIADMSDVLFVGVEPKLNKDGTLVMEQVLNEKGEPKRNKITGELVMQPVLMSRKSKEDIWEKMWEIPATSKSLVVMTQEKFGSIPMRPDTKAGYAAKMVERHLISDKNAAALSAGAAGKDGEAEERKVSYDDDKAKARIEGKYSDEGTAKKGELPYFEDMGFTSIIFDEAHGFKNSYEAGEQTSQIAYLPSAPSSKRALDMTMKCAYLRDNNDGRGVYPMTATPVTNSPFEVYNMLSYVAPIEEFERFGVYTVDDFVRVFGKIETVDKVMVSGDVKSKDGLTGFRNLDGLRNLFHKYTVLKTAEDVGLELPPHDELHEDVDLTEEQSNLYVSLREDAKAASVPGSKVSMFSVIRKMDRVTMDTDLYKRQMTFVFKAQDRAKVEALASELPATVDGYEEDENGKQIKVKVPCEPKFKTDGDSFIMVVPEAAEDIIATKIKRHGLDENDITHPMAPKYAKLVENIRKHLEAHGKQIVFTEEKSQHRKIKRLLSHHIPLSRDMIAIINADEAAGDKIQQISDQYNSGKVKIVIANKKAEVGVNLQKGTTAIHHLTLPWTPASIQQRNGRGVRQGNTAAHIQIYYYMGKGSFDMYRLDLLKRKSGWMHELLTGEATEAENANALGADDMLDLLADDPEEAKRRRMGRLAKQKADRDERERKRLVNMLQQLSNVAEALAGLEDAKEKRKEKLDEKIPKLQKQIDELKSAGAKMDPGEAKTAMAERLTRKKRELSLAEGDLKSLDEVFARKRADLETKKKQSQSILKLKAGKGELPFDAALVDNPQNAVAGLDGTLYAVGETYEARDKDGDLLGIFKIASVHADPKAVSFEEVVSHGYYSMRGDTWVKGAGGNDIRANLLSKLPDLVKVAYSEAELALKKLLSKRHTYLNLMEGGIDKETFEAHAAEIKMDGDGLLRTDTGHAWLRIYDAAQLIFPEPGSEVFRKALAQTYLAAAREKRSYVDYSLKSCMEKVFGSDWEGAAAEYGKKATETEIRAFYADYTKTWIDENIRGGSNDPDYMQLRDYRSKLYSDVRLAAKSLGDNTDEIMRVIVTCYDAAKDELDKKVIALVEAQSKAEDEARAERERQENERLKADPNYKEVPEDARAAFAQLGIEVKINRTNTVLPGRRTGRYKKYRDVEIPAFKKWFFQDNHGKSGVLFRVKEILKVRYGAQFFSGTTMQLDGAYWYVNSSYPLDEIYKVMT